MMIKVLVDNNGRIVTKKQNGKTLYCAEIYNPMQNNTHNGNVQLVDKDWLCKNSVYISNVHISKNGKLTQCQDKYTQLFEDFVKLFRSSLRKGTKFSWCSLDQLVGQGIVTFNTSGGLNFDFVKSLNVDTGVYCMGHDEYILKEMHNGNVSLSGGSGSNTVLKACGLLILWGVNIQMFLCRAYNEAEKQEKANSYHIVTFYDKILREYAVYSVKTQEDIERMTKKVNKEDRFQEVKEGHNSLHLDAEMIRPLHDLYNQYI